MWAGGPCHTAPAMRARWRPPAALCNQPTNQPRSCPPSLLPLAPPPPTPPRSTHQHDAGQPLVPCYVAVVKLWVVNQALALAVRAHKRAAVVRAGVQVRHILACHLLRLCAVPLVVVLVVVVVALRQGEGWHATGAGCRDAAWAGSWPRLPPPPPLPPPSAGPHLQRRRRGCGLHRTLCSCPVRGQGRAGQQEARQQGQGTWASPGHLASAHGACQSPLHADQAAPAMRQALRGAQPPRAVQGASTAALQPG